MEGQGILLICIFVPLIGAFLLPALGRISAALRNVFALVFVLASLISAVLMLPDVVQGTPLSVRMELPLGLSFGFLADGLAVFMAITASLVAAIIVF